MVREGDAGRSLSVRKSAESRSGRRRTAPPRILRAIERSSEPYESARGEWGGSELAGQRVGAERNTDRKQGGAGMVFSGETARSRCLERCSAVPAGGGTA